MNESLERRGAGHGMTATLATGRLRDHSSHVTTAGIILALLCLGRSVLIPLALAIMLSLLVARLIRARTTCRSSNRAGGLNVLSGVTPCEVCIAIPNRIARSFLKRAACDF